MATYKLTPSDLTFLWDECPRCFYLKVVHGFKRPGAPFPSIFGRIDRLMKTHFQGQPSDSLDPSLPPGRVQFSDRWVRSQPIRIPDRGCGCYLVGRFDAALAFEDGSYGVIDFKTSRPRSHFLEFYGRQLHAYAYTLEHPEEGQFGLAPVTRLGLFVVEPNAMQAAGDGRLAYLGAVTWIEVPRNEAGFLEFLGGVMDLLDAPEPPPPGEACTYCQYRQEARDNPDY